MKMEDIVKFPDGKVTIVCTGSQGEFSAVLNRMASGAHKYIKIKNTESCYHQKNKIGNYNLAFQYVEHDIFNYLIHYCFLKWL